MHQDNNSKSNHRNKNKAPIIAQRNDVNGLPITYFGSWSHVRSLTQQQILKISEGKP